jgi:hypothetical protein
LARSTCVDSCSVMSGLALIVFIGGSSVVIQPPLHDCLTAIVAT